MITFVLWASVLITAVTAILAYTTMSILARFREQREHMSAKVRYMQRQLNLIMFAEVRRMGGRSTPGGVCCVKQEHAKKELETQARPREENGRQEPGPKKHGKQKSGKG